MSVHLDADRSKGSKRSYYFRVTYTDAFGEKHRTNPVAFRRHPQPKKPKLNSSPAMTNRIAPLSHSTTS